MFVVSSWSSHVARMTMVARQVAWSYTGTWSGFGTRKKEAGSLGHGGLFKGWRSGQPLAQCIGLVLTKMAQACCARTSAHPLVMRLLFL